MLMQTLLYAPHSNYMCASNLSRGHTEAVSACCIGLTLYKAVRQLASLLSQSVRCTVTSRRRCFVHMQGWQTEQARPWFDAYHHECLVQLLAAVP